MHAHKCTRECVLLPTPVPPPSQIHRPRGPTEALFSLVEESTKRWEAHEPVTDDTTVIIAALKAPTA